MRVWVYQASRKLSAEEEEKVSQYMQVFVGQWQAHGQSLSASFELRHGLFLILQVDEAQAMASGCSIDSSVHYIQQMQQELGLDFFQRQNIAYEHQGEVSLVALDEFISLIQEEKLGPETPIFNVAISDSEQLESQLTIPANQSWVARFLKAKA